MFYLITKNLSHKFKKFITLQTNIFLKKSLNLYKLYNHTTNLYAKKAMKQVNKKIHMLQKYTIRINILKLNSNKN